MTTKTRKPREIKAIDDLLIELESLKNKRKQLDAKIAAQAKRIEDFKHKKLNQAIDKLSPEHMQLLTELVKNNDPDKIKKMLDSIE